MMHDMDDMDDGRLEALHIAQLHTKHIAQLHTKHIHECMYV